MNELKSSWQNNDLSGKQNQLNGAIRKYTKATGTVI
jgi:hypothetical protein